MRDDSGETRTELTDHKYLNPECGLSGCQWLVAQHQVEVYREQMAKAEADARVHKARADTLMAAGQLLLAVCLAPHDVSGSEMFKTAAANFREEARAMSFEFNPADEDPHAECRHEIHRLKDALVNLLKSRDVSWEDGKHGGHDWSEAVAEAMRALI